VVLLGEVKVASIRLKRGGDKLKCLGHMQWRIMSATNRRDRNLVEGLASAKWIEAMV